MPALIEGATRAVAADTAAKGGKGVPRISSDDRAASLVWRAAELPASVVPEVRFGASAKFPEPPTTVPSEDKAAEAAPQQTADKEKCIVM